MVQQACFSQAAENAFCFCLIKNADGATHVNNDIVAFFRPGRECEIDLFLDLTEPDPSLAGQSLTPDLADQSGYG